MKNPLVSPEVAIDLGYQDGADLRRRHGHQPGQLDTDILTHGARYAGLDLYGHWLKGFRAGHSGERKPIA
jgi:hypothetical protein